MTGPARPGGKGIPRPHTRGQRPQIWVTGPDPVRHEKFRVWTQQRNQALWRGEAWQIDFDTWVEIWGDAWASRGRERGTLCMTRRDWEQPWCRENVQIVTREDHAQRQGRARAEGWCSQAQRIRRGRRGQIALDLE